MAFYPKYSVSVHVCFVLQLVAAAAFYTPDIIQHAKKVFVVPTNSFILPADD